MTNTKKMPKRLRYMLSVGCLLATLTPFLARQFPYMPDFLVGSLSGIGIGLMIGVLIKQRKLMKAGNAQ